MAETVTLPSPPLMLPSPDSAPLLLATASTPAPPPLPVSARGLNPAQASGVTKRKQSKSRNGCLTCKAKRLKCDETKPTCQQCARRAVTCGGYKKDFKWRPFEEPNVPGKPPAKTRKDSGPQDPPLIPPNFHHQYHAHEQQYGFANVMPNIQYAALPPAHYGFQQHPHLRTSFIQTSFPVDNPYAAPQSSPFLITPQSISPVESFAPSSLTSQSRFGTEGTDTRPSHATAPSSTCSGQSPQLMDLLLPGTDLSVPPAEYSSFLTQHEAFYQPTGLTPPAPIDDEIEEIPRDAQYDSEAWVMRLPSPASSSSSGSSSDSPSTRIPAQPQFSLASPEALTRRYDRDTCGVLSVKDGPTENPWRTLVWPLARDCPALYHAIASMTSFHQSKETPSMRIQGIDHMRNAVHALAAGLQNMRFDAAISTTLVLAFAESWDQHISTGINHIKGAKILINQALLQHRQTPKQGEEWARLKFLCNTWIYMDVISRLTSADDDDETNDVDAVHRSIYDEGETETSLDPLMGCASTLFPIIGRVANLVRKVRKAQSNGPGIISQAMKLKAQLEDWTPPSYIEDPEDETTSPHDSVKTAVAYQYATILYLHQAVPEIPSLSSIQLAKRVLCELATVKPESRSIIVHIYPLTAAGCEVTDQEDRDWVLERWGFLTSRMKLGILDRCLEVTKEVWARRDTHAEERVLLQDLRADGNLTTASLKRSYESLAGEIEAAGDCCWLDSGSKRRALDSMAPYAVSGNGPVAGLSSRVRHASLENTELLEHDFTVKGRLHWLRVMRDWSWEVLLG
ncbi:hypothetical protein ACN47E_007740 [Coniothyrium glycines]